MTSAVEKDMEANLEYIEKNKKSLLKEHQNKYLLVYKQNLVDTFDTYEKAAEEGIRMYGVEETFLVYQIVEDEPVNFVLGAAF